MAATAAAEKTPDHWLTAPACWLIVERVSEPEPGMHWKKLPARLADSLAEALLVDVQLLAGLGGDGLGHGDRLQQSQNGHPKGVADQQAHAVPLQAGQFKVRQGGGDLADDLDPLLVQVEDPDQQSHDDHGHQVLRDGNPDAVPSQPAVDSPHAEHEGDGPQADQDGRVHASGRRSSATARSA